MDKPRVSSNWEEEASEMLHVLHLHWHRRYCPEEIRSKLKELLQELKKVLASDRSDARFILCTYRRLFRHEVLTEELELANHVLQRMVAELSGVVVSVLPFSFITLPRVLALARHLGIDLLPAEEDGEKEEEKTCIYKEL